MTQLDIFAARAARDEALTVVDAGAPADWKAAALDAVRHLARMLPEFTTDDVWVRLRGNAPAEPRALGAVMQHARALGLIEPTDRIRTSARPECHARPVRVWRSL